ncbi:hypothetical protein GTV32_02690 [Gordonia sp. SID5947]|uniref:hypothetical protein n=1 Tax=Gordonia sp. SID5947 TaxID=2690315 RepID=UPI00136F544A|nr:hypothetical protein [Gordonia sp. SID5947]MYR05292.1 hypothetical protein [Gordonia sp. SID5947]
MNTHTPYEAVTALRAHPDLPGGSDERFAGYGVMGIPFASGHYLALREMLASSLGAPYRTIWHRDPQGRWTIHTTTDPAASCPRYFGAGADVRRVPAIDISWTDGSQVEVALGDELRWRLELASSPATRILTAMGAAMPMRALTSASVLTVMGPMAGAVLGSGRMRLCGRTPNGPLFRATPLQVWRVASAEATHRGQNLGAPAPLDVQTALGDFWLPQRGLFFVGQASFTPPPARAGDVVADDAEVA